MLCIKKTQKYN